MKVATIWLRPARGSTKCRGQARIAGRVSGTIRAVELWTTACSRLTIHWRTFGMTRTLYFRSASAGVLTMLLAAPAAGADFSDGFKVSGVRLQFSFKYSFSAKVGE